MQKLLRFSCKPNIASAATAAGSILLLLLFADAARADNVIERAISNAQPCQSLKFNAGFTTIGVDKFESVDVKAASIAIQENTATMSLDGSLACKTSDSALIKGDVSATIHFQAEVDLESCAVTNDDAQILQTDGSLKKFVDLLKPQIAAGLKTGLFEQLTKLCKQ